MHDWRADIKRRLASSNLNAQDEAEIMEEVGQHLEEQFAELAPRIGVVAAREQLLAELNNPDFDHAAHGRRQRSRRERSRTWSTTSLKLDLRYGLRSLRRSPGTVAAGTAALALGIGLTTVMFSIIYGMLIKGLPFANAEQIAAIKHADPAQEATTIGVGDFVRYRSEQRSFQSFGGYVVGTATISGGDRADRVATVRTSAGTIEVAGVRPMLGRTFTADDSRPGAAPVVVIGHAMWRERFAGDSGVIGRTARVNGLPHTIAGVMPEQFVFPVAGIKMWLPLQIDPSIHAGEGMALNVIGRLKNEANYDVANSEFATLAKQLSREHAKEVEEFPVVVEPFIKAAVPSRVYSVMYAMLGTVLLVLLVACANVANLLLDRTLARSREIGIRTALGASRLAVIRQALIESAFLALFAAAIGSALAYGGIVAFNRSLIESDRPFWTNISLHPPVLLFVLLIAILASLVSGLLPAMQSARVDINTILKDESQMASTRRVGRLSRGIVTVEIMLSAAMLLVSGFLTKSIVKLRAVEPGFASANVFTARISATPGDSTAHRMFFETVEQQLSALPGVQGAYIGNELPGTGWRGGRIEVEGQAYANAKEYPSIRWLATSPGFFSTFDVRMQRGRAIASTDRVNTLRVSVVSESFVRRHYPNGGDPIGRRIRINGAESEQGWLTIVGVMPTLYSTSVQNPWPAEVLTAYAQERVHTSATIALRGPSDVATAASVRKVIAALDPDVPVYASAFMDDVLAERTWYLQVFGSMFVIFGVTSLVLAAIGLYAVMAFSVGRRTREMGIRMALGAQNGDVIRMVCRQGATQIFVGLALGFMLGAAAMRALRQALFEVQPGDPSVFALVAGVLAAAAFIACIVPAVRATRVNPTVALRAE